MAKFKGKFLEGPTNWLTDSSKGSACARRDSKTGCEPKKNGQAAETSKQKKKAEGEKAAVK